MINKIAGIMTALTAESELQYNEMLSAYKNGINCYHKELKEVGLNI